MKNQTPAASTQIKSPTPTTATATPPPPPSLSDDESWTFTPSSTPTRLGSPAPIPPSPSHDLPEPAPASPPSPHDPPQPSPSQPQPEQAPNLTTLPPEIHLHISTHLPYPDILALKHTSRHFYLLIPTTIPQRIAWLVSRANRGLECPTGGCDVRSDEAFCASGARRPYRPNLATASSFPGWGGSWGWGWGGRGTTTTTRVRDLINRRRRHGDCNRAGTGTAGRGGRGGERGGGCEVFIGEPCGKGRVRVVRGLWPEGVVPVVARREMQRRRRRAVFWLVAILVLVWAVLF